MKISAKHLRRAVYRSNLIYIYEKNLSEDIPAPETLLDVVWRTGARADVDALNVADHNYDETRKLLRHANARALLERCHAFILGRPVPAQRNAQLRQRQEAAQAGDASEAQRRRSRRRRGGRPEGTRPEAAKAAAAQAPARNEAKAAAPAPAPAPNGKPAERPAREPGQQRRRRRRRRGGRRQERPDRQPVAQRAAERAPEEPV